MPSHSCLSQDTHTRHKKDTLTNNPTYPHTIYPSSSILCLIFFWCLDIQAFVQNRTESLRTPWVPISSLAHSLSSPSSPTQKLTLLIFSFLCLWFHDVYTHIFTSTTHLSFYLTRGRSGCVLMCLCICVRVCISTQKFRRGGLASSSLLPVFCAHVFVGMPP